MPPIIKISKEMILDAGFSIVKTEGIDNLNVRNIANKLNCSTQPVMYQYKNMNILKEELYEIANEYHTEYLFKITQNENPLLSIGIRYIKFALEERNLFKFLFESNKFKNLSFLDLINDNESKLNFIFEIISKEANMSVEDSKELFENIFISAHGMASLIANNSMKFDKKYIIKILENSYDGALNKIKGESKK